MRKHPQDKTGSCKFIGNQAEQVFAETMETEGHEVAHSSMHEDCRKHIDFFLTKGGETKSYQVKSIRKFLRRNKGYNNSHALFEISKNQGKRDGTAFKTQSDFMVFFRKGEFLVFPTKGLKEVCEKYVKFDEYTGENDYENFKLKLRHSGGPKYGTKARVEELTIIPYDFLKEKLAHESYAHDLYKSYEADDRYDVERAT